MTGIEFPLRRRFSQPGRDFVAAVRGRACVLAKGGLALFAGLVALAAFSSSAGAVLRLVPWREAAHFGAFFILTFAAALGFPRVRLVPIAVVTGLSGGAVEVLQGLPWIGRHCALGDWIADVLGAATVVAVSALIAFRQSRTATRRGPPRRPQPASRYDRLTRASRWPGR